MWGPDSLEIRENGEEANWLIKERAERVLSNNTAGHMTFLNK